MDIEDINKKELDKKVLLNDLWKIYFEYNKGNHNKASNILLKAISDIRFETNNYGEII